LDEIEAPTWEIYGICELSLLHVAWLPSLNITMRRPLSLTPLHLDSGAASKELHPCHCATLLG